MTNHIKFVFDLPKTCGCEQGDGKCDWNQILKRCVQSKCNMSTGGKAMRGYGYNIPRKKNPEK